MRVIFIRHAQSEYNVKNLVNQDFKIKVDITEYGRRQAKEAGKKLENEKFDIIFVSDFLRTQQTAKIVLGEREIEIKVNKKINEIKLGYEGEDAELYRKDRRTSGMKINLFKKSEELESFHDVKLRIEKFVNWLKNEKYKIVLIVTHEICCQCARSIFEGILEEEAFSTPVGNCEFFEYEI